MATDDDLAEKASRRILVAGATGAIGRALCPLLVEAGWHVVGTTRFPERCAGLRALGVEPAVVDVYDAAALLRVVTAARPEVIVHQLTDLPPGLDPARMAEARVRNARIRDVGTRHLIAAAAACGVGRMVVQSIAFAYQPSPTPYREEAPLAAPALAAFEQQVLDAPLAGLVLRYGKLYGPGTGFDAPPQGGPVHVDAAADAARRAIERGAPGVYNVAEDDGTVSSRKAVAELGWDPAFRARRA